MGLSKEGLFISKRPENGPILRAKIKIFVRNFQAQRQLFDIDSDGYGHYAIYSDTLIEKMPKY